METTNSTHQNGTDTKSNPATTTTSDDDSDEDSGLYVCQHADDCYAVLPTPGARRSHHDRAHSNGGDA